MNDPNTPNGAADVLKNDDLLKNIDALLFVNGNAEEDTCISDADATRTAAAVAALIARNAELEALCDATYVAQGADAYIHACETMEAWQGERRAAGKEPGCEGSLCDGLSWLQSQVTKLEDERDALTSDEHQARLAGATP